MKAVLRRGKIIEILELKNSINLQELANILNVSKMTLYRDVAFLNKNRGGIRLAPPHGQPSHSYDNYCG